MQPSLQGTRLEGLDDAAGRQVMGAAQALDTGRIDEAVRQLGPALAAFPEHPEVLRMQAGILGLQGNFAEAIGTMRKALLLRPQDALYVNTLGTLFGNSGDFDSAVTSLRRCCELQPDMATAWFNLGIMLTRCVRNEEAADVLRRAVTLAPDDMEARALLADLLRTTGQVDEAAAAYRTILAEQPATGIAWWGLADLRTADFSAEDRARMLALVEQDAVGDNDRIATGFALAKSLDQIDRYDESLAALANANAMARRRQKWNAVAFSRTIDTIGKAFGHSQTRAPDGLGTTAIFVVGLPRSGSTLVEQILATHSQVQGAGELPDLPLVLAEESRRQGKPFPQWVEAMQPDDWQRLGQRYLDRTEHWRGERPMFIDKLPNNWMYLDAIGRMLPSAHVVICRRDPVETCFSCYRQYLVNNEYTRTFEDLAAFWRDFDQVARRVAAADPKHVFEHGYEQLVQDPEPRIRQLLAACGLKFEEACLTFHENERAVRSPSATQVRQPLHDTARAPHYGARLDALRAALGVRLHEG
jgi:Flp pilus assembly protein TadD